MDEPGIRYVVAALDGSIRQIGIVQELAHLAEIVPEDAFALPGGEEADHDAARREPGAWRVVNGLLEPRTEMACSLDRLAISGDGVECATLSGIPEGATVTVAGLGTRTMATADGTPVEIVARSAGEIALSVRHPAHLDWTAVIRAD